MPPVLVVFVAAQQELQDPPILPIFQFYDKNRSKEKVILIGVFKYLFCLLKYITNSNECLLGQSITHY